MTAATTMRSLRLSQAGLIILSRITPDYFV